MTCSFQFIIYWCKWFSQPLNKFQCSIRFCPSSSGKDYRAASIPWKMFHIVSLFVLIYLYTISGRSS